jgi:hypothetical protein
VEVPVKRLPTTVKLEVQRELDRIRRSLNIIEARLSEQSDDSDSLSDDTLVDQRTVRAPKDLYLRLARAGAFESQKHGRRIVARWGDVRRVLLAAPPDAARTLDASDDVTQHKDDGLDGLRRRIGLVRRAQ